MYFDNLEWETISWPIKVTNVNCVPNTDNLPSNSIFEIYRDGDHKLKGKVTGIREGIRIPQNVQNYEMNISSTVFGYSSDGIKKYKINDVVLGNFSLQHTKRNEEIFENFSQDVYLNSIEEIFSENSSDSLYEYYLSQKLDIFFPRMTSRKQTNSYFKIRETQQNSEDESPNFVDNSLGSSWDYMLIQTADFDFIIQKDNNYSPNWADGIIIEYRKDFKEIPSKETRTAISEIVSFALGTHLLNIGSTELDSKNFILRRTACSPWGNNVIIKCRQSATPPINLFGYRKKETVENEITNLVNKYLIIHKEYNLSGILWRLWISQMTPIGTNLPILSSALENLASKYLEINSLKHRYSPQEKKKYNCIIAPIIMRLETELDGYEFKTRLLSNLSNPYNKGTGGYIVGVFKTNWD